MLSWDVKHVKALVETPQRPFTLCHTNGFEPQSGQSRAITLCLAWHAMQT